MASTAQPTPWPYAAPRRPPRPLQAPSERPGRAPRTMRFKHASGELVEAVYIGELARRLGRSAHTVRRWERLGVLPATPFEQWVRRGAPRRLYPLAWVEGVVAIAEGEGLIGRRPVSFADSRFTERTQELHRRLFG